MSEVMNIPKLRFPEFSGGWEWKKLGEVFSLNSKSIKPYEFPDEIFHYYNLPSYDEHGNYIEIKGGAIQSNKTLLPVDCILVSKLNPRKPRIMLVEKKGKRRCSSTEFMSYVPMTHELDLGFYKFFFFSNLFQNRLQQVATGSTNSHVRASPKETLKWKIPTLPLLEQQKIASFLTEVDTKIELLSKKQTLLGKYKKGLMQQIFSQAIRFKADDGSLFPDWNSGKLGNYGNLINGLTYSPDNIVNKGLLVLRSSNIQNGRISLNDKVYVSLEVRSEALTREDDILICVRNGSKRLIGKSTIINKNMPKSTHGAFMTVFRGESNKFISHWFQSSIYYKEVHKNLGATINSINGSDLKKFKTIFPTKPEQIKIANFLTSIDNKIKEVNRQLDEVKQFKKALLQQMFV